MAKVVNSNNPAEMFKSFIEQKKYQEARDLLMKTQHDWDPAIFLYNKGLLDIHNDHLAQARLSLELAQSQGFYSHESQQALTFVKQELGVDFVESESSWQDSITYQLFQIPSSVYLSASLLFGVIFLLSFKKIQQLFLKGIFAIIVAAPFLFSVSYLQQYERVFLLDDIKLFSGPSEIFENITELPAGVSLIIKRSENSDWCYVKFPRNLQGWAKIKDVGK